MPSYDPTDSKLVNQVYTDINQGWLVVKILEIIIIPYIYMLMRPNKIGKILYWIALVDIIHNIFGYVASYMGDIGYDGEVTTYIWLVQAASAAWIRCLELYVNYLTVNAIAKPEERLTLKIVTIVGGVLVVAGRVYDNFFIRLISITGVRVGMAIVAFGGLIQSTYCLYVIRSTVKQLVGVEEQVSMHQGTATQKGSRIQNIMSKSSFRIMFIQLIDVIEIIGALFMRNSIYTLWWDMVAGNLDNSRGLFMALDLLITKFVNNGGAKTTKGGATQIAPEKATKIDDNTNGNQSVKASAGL